MKIADIRSKHPEELTQLLQENCVKLGKMQFEKQAKTLKKTHELGMLKRDIARIRSIINERKK